MVNSFGKVDGTSINPGPVQWHSSSVSHGHSLLVAPLAGIPITIPWSFPYTNNNFVRVVIWNVIHLQRRRGVHSGRRTCKKKIKEKHIRYKDIYLSAIYFSCKVHHYHTSRSILLVIEKYSHMCTVFFVFFRFFGCNIKEFLYVMFIFSRSWRSLFLFFGFHKEKRKTALTSFHTLHIKITSNIFSLFLVG